MSDIAVGQTIRLNDGRNAIVRFVGQTHFAIGDWVGVELEDDGGKNDGSVQGTRYFDCEMGRGMFVRPAALTILQAAPPPQPRVTVPPVRRGSRPSVAGRAGSVTDSKRRSLNAPSPSPVPRRASTNLARVRKVLTGHILPHSYYAVFETDHNNLIVPDKVTYEATRISCPVERCNFTDRYSFKYSRLFHRCGC